MFYKFISSFHFRILIISLIGGALRILNITYSSLWGDELYSMFSVHPTNSWYEVLYWQRALQPPLYFMVLWVWVKVFAYNEFYARLLSVIAGTAAILVSGYLGRRVKNQWVGVGMALFVAFSPVQIWYSLEARFYVFVYVFAALSLLIYWNLVLSRSRNRILYVLKSCLDAALCYFHHFGIIFVFAHFCFDVYLLHKERNLTLFLYKLTGYALSALFYFPWVLWGLTEGLAVKQYWVNETNISNYFLFGFSMSNIWVQCSATILILFFIFCLIRSKVKYHYYIFPVIVFLVILVPVVYSYVKLPILVNRYAMVMTPALYTMLIIGVHEIVDKFNSSKLIKLFLTLIFILFFSYNGFNISLFHKGPLDKTPFRQMAEWIKKQPDFQHVNVYTYPVWYKNFIITDFYLNRSISSISILNLKVGTDKKMYLVGGTGYWHISDSLMADIYKSYKVTKIEFLNKLGIIYACEKMTDSK